MKIVSVFLIAIVGLVLFLSSPARAELEVSRAVFCTNIEDKEPVGIVDSVSADVGKVYFFAEIKGATEDTTIYHVWYHEGDEVAKVEINIGGPRWRTWSYKTIPPDMKGKWGVEVTDAEGNVLKPVSLEVK